MIAIMILFRFTKLTTPYSSLGKNFAGIPHYKLCGDDDLPVDTFIAYFLDQQLGRFGSKRLCRQLHGCQLWIHILS